MELLVIELAVLAVFMTLGWMVVRMNKLEERVEHAVDQDALAEVKADLKEALKLLTENRVENARWQVLIEEILKRD